MSDFIQSFPQYITNVQKADIRNCCPTLYDKTTTPCVKS